MYVPMRLFLYFLVAISAAGRESLDPYGCEGAARDLGQTHSLKKLRAAEANLASTAKTAKDFCTVAELYKRLGDGRAREYYDKAIQKDAEEPAYELFYEDYLRIYHVSVHVPPFPLA